jgi:hypothetical protein
MVYDFPRVTRIGHSAKSTASTLHLHGLDAETRNFKLGTWHIELVMLDDLVKNRRKDGFIKSSRCKARKN